MGFPEDVTLILIVVVELGALVALALLIRRLYAKWLLKLRLERIVRDKEKQPS